VRITDLGPIFELRTCRIRSRSANHPTATFNLGVVEPEGKNKMPEILGANTQIEEFYNDKTRVSIGLRHLTNSSSVINARGGLFC
jgi:hypothetical protein